MKYLKTYGKHKTKIPAWISIQDRKQAFDSTSHSEADCSTHQATRTRKTRNFAKKKAFVQLSSEDEESIFTHPKRLSYKKTARLKQTKRKLPSLSVSSDEENVPPTPKTPKVANFKKPRGKKSRKYSDKNSSDKTPDDNDENVCPPMLSQNRSGSNPTSFELREMNTKTHEQTAQGHKTLQKDSLVHLPSAGRFVTRRRCPISSSPRPLMLNSSDEFISNGIIRPSRKKRCPVFLESSADSSVHAAALRRFITVPLRDISLNESAEQSLGPCSTKPIFCSTPSAAPLGKKSKLKSFHPTSSPPSISVSCIGPVSTFQADLGSPEQLSSPPHVSPSEPSVEKRATIDESQKDSPSHHVELCDSAVIALSKSSHEKTGSSGASHSQCEEGLTQGSHEMPSVLTISSDLSSYFTSASGELNWLNDILKEKCLTQICTVRLERLEDLIQLFSETPYSSCLGSASSSNAKEHSRSVDTSHTSQHRLFSESSSSAKLAGSVESCSVQHIVSVTDSQCTEPSKSNDCEKSEHKSSFVLFSDSENSCSDIADRQVQDHTEELSTIIKNMSFSRECSVQLKKLPRSSIEQHLTPELNHCENEQSKVRLSAKNSITVCESQTEDKADLIKELKEKCLDSKPFVEMRKMSVTEIKLSFQESNVVLNRNVSLLISEQTEPESNSTKANLKTTMNSFEVGRCRKRTSDSSNDSAVSDKDVLKPSSNKMKKMAHKEKKQRSPTHRLGTTRKACINGVSVSRWKNRDAFTSGIARTKVVDCSINELIPSRHKQTVELTEISKNFSTPIKGNNLNLSSLLNELTPHTQTWSRLKAALSVHRKVILTPKTPGPSSKVALADISQDLFATPFKTPLPRHLRSQLMTHESQLVFEDDDLSDAEKVYAECGQQGPLSWEECLLPQRIKQCVKIGEGTFGEVFSTTSGKSNKETVALKVIPVEGSEKVNGEEQKTFGEILHEIIISKELSSLKEKEKNQTSGFIGLRDLHCVKGCYPPQFLKAWDKFDKQKRSENDRPDFFEKDQLFIILEFEFGGTDLENCNGTLPSIVVAKSILHQVTAALAVAEQELHFEHRDLHWGNVLVKMTKEKITDFSLNGTVLTLETKGVLVRIIDYSLSRLEIDELTVSCDISNDEELFMGQGDYQFEVYRLMKKENGNDWCAYNPHTNILWLHYLCGKLLDMKYRTSRGRRNKDIRGELNSFYDNVLGFASATEVLQNSPLFQ